MKLAICLGRMGGSMTERLLGEGHDIVVDGGNSRFTDSGRRAGELARWTVHEAVEMAIPVPALADILFARFASRQLDSFSAKVIAAMRKQFGGHAVRSAQEK